MLLDEIIFLLYYSIGILII